VALRAALRKAAPIVLSPACLLLWSGSSNAQNSAYTVAVQVPGVSEATVYTGAPEAFDPESASDQELQSYGYPRRPDPNDAKPYGLWLRAVHTTRVTTDLVPNPGRVHLPMQSVGPQTTVDNTTNVKSGNWSGYSLVGGSPIFNEVVGLWIVPNVASQSENITGYSSMWVGIDGNCSCNDLIQDGTDQDWVNGKAVYRAWIEFIPESEIPLSGLTVNPGDVIYAYSAAEEKSGKITGYYYVANLNTNKSVSTSLAMPKGDTFVGKSVEWIVERPQINGSFQNPMPDYGRAYMADAFAYRSGSNTAIAFSSEANQYITMVDKSGNALSKAVAQDADSIWFEWLAY
jgi:hypothetical protein